MEDNILIDLGEDISNPSHYAWFEEQYKVPLMCILNHFNYTQANMFKYILRSGHKKGEELKDLEKALNLIQHDLIENENYYTFNYAKCQKYRQNVKYLVDALCKKLDMTDPLAVCNLYIDLADYGYIRREHLKQVIWSRIKEKREKLF